MEKVYFKTVFKLTVLSKNRTAKGLGLDELLHETDEGDMSGSLECVSVEQVSPAEMARLALAQGAAPEFFGLDEQGNRLDPDPL